MVPNKFLWLHQIDNLVASHSASSLVFDIKSVMFPCSLASQHTHPLA